MTITPIVRVLEVITCQGIAQEREGSVMNRKVPSELHYCPFYVRMKIPIAGSPLEMEL